MLVAGLLLAATAHAFEPTVNSAGVEIQWEVMPVYWSYDDEGRPGELDREAAHAAIRASFEAWNHVPDATVRYIEAGPGIDPDQVNPVYWIDDWEWDADILALTSTWSTEKGDLIGFSIALNAEDHDWTTEGQRGSMDLQNALAHEVGHALGLGHDPDHAEATMAPTATDGETRKRDLHRSDEDGARYLYPGEGANTPMSCSSGDAPPALGLALLGAALAAADRRRRRRAA